MCLLACRLFEPYVIHVIGKLLNCYSDSARLVREGAHAAARAIMANLSGQGGTIQLHNGPIARCPLVVHHAQQHWHIRDCT